MKRILSLLMALTLVLSMMAASPALALNEGTWKSLTPAPHGSASLQDEASAKATDDNYIIFDKSSLTLKKGKSATLKATLNPADKKAKVTWKSTNSKVAKVSKSGKVTAVAQGTVWIYATAKNYYSAWCYVTVNGSSKSPKLLNSNDLTFYYGSTKLSAKNNYNTVKELVPGGNYVEYCDDYYYYYGLAYGSKDQNKSHTNIWFDMYDDDYCHKGTFSHYYAYEKSPIKTNRGIKVGDKKSSVTAKYGQPSEIYQAKLNGKTYEVYYYYVKLSSTQNIAVSFIFQKSKNTVAYMHGSYAYK